MNSAQISHWQGCVRFGGVIQPNPMGLKQSSATSDLGSPACASLTHQAGIEFNELYECSVNSE